MSKKYKLSPGTWIERDLFESAAFSDLRGWSPQLLIIIYGKRRFEMRGRKGKEKRFCTNEDSITMTYIEAQKKYGITNPRLTRAIDELLAKGFITIVYHGGNYKQDKTIYGLSDQWMLWRPGAVFEARPRDAATRGHCKPKTKVANVNVPIHTNVNVPKG